MSNTTQKYAEIASPRGSRRYERLIGTLLSTQLIDPSTLERRAIYDYVSNNTQRHRGRCSAMRWAAARFGCSYEKVRKVVYDTEHNLSSLKQMHSSINIRNEADCTTIDIEGTIGLSEQWQFDNPDSRVATYEAFREKVSHIANIADTHIIVNIRSTGGDVNDAILIYEALRATGAHITTRCYGYTASAATIVAQAASEGSREIAASSLYLIHNSLCSTEGNAEELQAEVEMLRQTDSRLAEIYATRSGVPTEQIAALMAENGGRGRWLSPAEVIEYGLADCLVAESVTPAREQSLGDRALKGVKALLKAIGLERDTHEAEDDINYIPRQRPTAAADHSTIAFEEAQRSATMTSLKEVEDPSLSDPTLTPRGTAYERDALSLRQR